MLQLHHGRNSSHHWRLQRRIAVAIFRKHAKQGISGFTRRRYGFEAFPFLMFLILIVVTIESLLANTFYKEAPRAGGPARAAA